MAYTTAFKHCWLTKGLAVGSAGWVSQVVLSEICPNQRLYRRLTRAERLLYENHLRRRPVHNA